MVEIDLLDHLFQLFMLFHVLIKLYLDFHDLIVPIKNEMTQALIQIIILTIADRLEDVFAIFVHDECSHQLRIDFLHVIIDQNYLFVIVGQLHSLSDVWCLYFRTWNFIYPVMNSIGLE